MNNSFTKYCRLIKIMNKEIFIRKSIRNEVFERALTYFDLGLRYSDILNASVNMSLLIFVVFSSLAFILNYSTTHLLVISLIFTLVIFFYLYYYIPIRYLSLSKNFSLYSPALLGIIYSVTVLGKPVTLALKIIADSNLPYISNDFRRMFNKACLGGNAAEILLKYSKVQPSNVFRENIKMALTQLLKRWSIEKIWEYSIWELSRMMLMETSKVEVISILIIGGGTFIPFLIYLFMIFNLVNILEVIVIVTFSFLTLIIFIGYRLIKHREKIVSNG